MRHAEAVAERLSHRWNDTRGQASRFVAAISTPPVSHCGRAILSYSVYPPLVMASSVDNPSTPTAQSEPPHIAQSVIRSIEGNSHPESVEEEVFSYDVTHGMPIVMI